MEQVAYNSPFRWFVGLGIDDGVWYHSKFTKNRDRLLDADVAVKFPEAVLRDKQVKRFLSDENFSVDRSLVPAGAKLVGRVRRRRPTTERSQLLRVN